MKHVRQVHKNDDGSKDVVMLGVWDAAYHKKMFKATKRTNSLQGSKQASVVQYYKDGDYCEVVKDVRKVKVKMICSKAIKNGQVTLQLDETSTCQYVLKVTSSVFCDMLGQLDENGLLSLE